VWLALLASGALMSGCVSSGGIIPSDLPVPPGVTVDVSEESFAIFGRSPQAIYQSLNQRGPANGGRFTWATQWERSADACRVGDLDLSMSTTITVPRWTQRAGSDIELQEMWDEFEMLLRKHEEDHRVRARGDPGPSPSDPLGDGPGLRDGGAPDSRSDRCDHGALRGSQPRLRRTRDPYLAASAVTLATR